MIPSAREIAGRRILSSALRRRLQSALEIEQRPFMKKALRQNDADAPRLPAQKIGRDSTWCARFGYFIDLEACRARSYQKRVCRRCYASLLQVPLPFEG